MIWRKGKLPVHTAVSSHVVKITKRSACVRLGRQAYNVKRVYSRLGNIVSDTTIRNALYSLTGSSLSGLFRMPQNEVRQNGAWFLTTFKNIARFTKGESHGRVSSRLEPQLLPYDLTTASLARLIYRVISCVWLKKNGQKWLSRPCGMILIGNISAI